MRLWSLQRQVCKIIALKHTPTICLPRIIQTINIDVSTHWLSRTVAASNLLCRYAQHRPTLLAFVQHAPEEGHGSQGSCKGTRRSGLLWQWSRLPWHPKVSPLMHNRQPSIVATSSTPSTLGHFGVTLIDLCAWATFLVRVCPCLRTLGATLRRTIGCVDTRGWP